MQARHPGRFNALARHRQLSRKSTPQTAELMQFLGLEGIEDIKGGDLSYGGQRLVDLGIALAAKPQIAAARRAACRSCRRRARAGVEPGRATISANIPVLIVEHDIDRVLASRTCRHRDEPGRGADDRHARSRALRPPRAGNLYRHRHTAGHGPRERPCQQCAARPAYVQGQYLLRQEPHPERRHARYARGGDCRPARPQWRRQIHAAEDGGRPGAGEIRQHRV